MTARRAAPRTILLVDADPTLRTIAKLHLSGVEVVEAADERAAFARLRGEGADLAICTQGSRMEVPAFLRRMRSDPERRVREVPVLIVAAARTDELAAASDAHPPAAILVAPVTGPRLATAVRALLSGPPAPR